MEKFEDILDQALLELKRGTSKPAIFSMWPQHQKELEQLLAVVEQFSSLPKNKVPEPAMQRKYLQVPIQTRAWFAWVHMSRMLSISMGALLLIAGFATTAYGAARSLPGQVLFPIRKTAEQIQLKFASNDIARANIQLKITQERLADAKVVFSSPNASAEQQTAALNELTSQTDVAVQTVKSAADNSQSKSPLVASLNNISTEQQALIKTIATSLPAGQAGTQPQAVAMLVAATANEQAVIISLNETAATGTATTTLTGSVKGIATSSPSSTLPSILTAATSSASSVTSTEQVLPDIPLPAPTQAVGTFIPEDPAPQFQP